MRIQNVHGDIDWGALLVDNGERWSRYLGNIEQEGNVYLMSQDRSVAFDTLEAVLISLYERGGDYYPEDVR